MSVCISVAMATIFPITKTKVTKELLCCLKNADISANKIFLSFLFNHCSHLFNSHS